MVDLTKYAQRERGLKTILPMRIVAELIAEMVVTMNH